MVNSLVVPFDYFDAMSQIEDFDKSSIQAEVSLDINQAFDGQYQVTRINKSSVSVTTALGIDQRDKREIFLKMLHCVPARQGMQMRLEHESQQLMGLESHHLATLLEVHRNNHALYLVFQHIEGDTLEKFVLKKPLGLTEALYLAESLFSALHDLHRLDILHRDVKPANILMPTGCAWQDAILVDFGPSSSTYSEALHHEDALVTSCFLSPEQAGSIDHDIGVPSDLYAAGAVLFNALVGRPPFTGESVGDILFQHMTSAVPGLATLGVAVPRALEELLQRLLRKDPRDRYQSSAAVLSDIRQIIHALEKGEQHPEIAIGASDVRITLAEPAFVSRGEELGRMDQLLQKTRDGHGGLVLLEADSGSGKTRLLVEMAQRATRDGVWVLRGKQTNQIGQRPLQLLDGVISGLSTDLKVNQHLAKSIRGALGDDLDALVASLPRLAEILNTVPHQDEGPEAFGEARSLRALTTLLDALGNAGRPTLILLDDCQWADELMFKLLERWSDAGLVNDLVVRNVLIVASFRTEEVSKSHPIRSVQHLQHLNLSPLTDDDLRRIAESMAGPLPEVVLETVTRLAGGSPFMASAVLRGLVESGALTGDSKGWKVDHTKILSTQSSSQAAELLTQRLDLLDTDTIAFLSVGAIFGKEFDLSAAAFMTEQSPSQAIAAVDKARRRCLVWVKPDQSVCVFIHDKIRAALLERLSSQDLGKIHRDVAKYLLSLKDIRESEVAFHFDASGDYQSALPYALVAAQQARSQYAFEIAEQQYRIAERGAAVADRLTKYRVAQGLGDVLMLRGDYESASSMFKKAVEYAQGKLRLAQIRGKLAEIAFKRGDMNHAVEDYEMALRTLDTYIPRRRGTFILLLVWESTKQILHTYLPWMFLGRRRRLPNESERLAVRLFSGLAHGSWYARSKIMTLWCHLKGMNMAESYLPTLELAYAYAEHAPVMTLLPLHRRAVRYAEKSLEICRSFEDPWGEGNSLHYYGCVLYAASRFSECVDKCREAVHLLERMGDYWQVHIARYQIAASYYHLGQFEWAIEQSQQNYQSGLDLGDEQASGIIFDVWERAAFGSVAEQPLKQELNRIRHDAQGQCQVLFARAVYLIHAGKTSEAVKTLQEANAVANEAGVKNAYTIPIMTWLATALRCEAQRHRGLVTTDKDILLRRADSVARHAVRAARICRNDLPRALREQAMIGAMRGTRAKKIRKLLEHSLQVAESLGEKYEYAKTLQVKGQIGQELGWLESADYIAMGQSLMTQLCPSDPGNSEPIDTVREPGSLSLADRFDTVLDSGRKVASGLTTSSIYQEIFSSALRLLRGQRCLVLEIEQSSPSHKFSPVAGNWEEDFDRDLIQRAIDAECAITGTEDLNDHSELQYGLQTTHSLICVPIRVRDRAAAVLLVANEQVAGLFGDDERRLADFIACLAGAALENAEGFEQLQNLNATLEQRVEDRTAAVESRASELKLSNEELERVAKELRQTEDELRVAVDETKQASQAKSQFLATMSH
ncbi:MAG: AAA family ATPase [Pirellulales bacterium]